MDVDCIKLISYFGERQRTNGTLVGDALINLYSKHAVTVSILLRGTQGFGLKHYLRTNSSLGPSADLPLTAIAVGNEANIEAVLDQTLELNLAGLVTLERARLLSDEIDPVGIVENADEATKLTVYPARHDRAYAVPAYKAICELLYRRGIAGATALVGVDGTAHGRRQRVKFFSGHADLPMMVIVVASGDRIGMVLPELGGLLRRPLMTLERVRICKRDGQLINRPEHTEGLDNRGFPCWQKLTVYTSGAARYEGQPIHRAMVRSLRSAGISGPTTYAGIWGFHGDRPPHGDHFLRLGRQAPYITTVIDAPERISAAFDILDKLTGEHGLITSETVSAVRAPSGRRQLDAM